MLDLSALSAWTDEHAIDMIKEAVLKGRTVDLIKVQGGIKHSATINRLSTDLVAQSGACGFNATGSTVLDQRTITVCDIKINESICLTDLEDYYTSVMMNPGSYNEEIPFEELFAGNKRDQLQALIEDLIWQGNTSTGTGNMALCDGFVKLFDGATGSVGAYGTYSASLSATDAIDVVDEMVASVPTNVINAEDLHLFMSYPDFRTYTKALRDANLFHYTGDENQGGDFTLPIPGTNVRAIAVRGLNGQDRMLLSPASNLYAGTDLLSDAEDFRIFYSQDNDEVRFISKFKIGIQCAYLENVVWYEGV